MTMAFLVALVAVVVAAAGPAAAAPVGTVTEGTLLWRAAGQQDYAPAPVLATDVEIRVTGLVARASVRQEFTNPGDTWAEGVYVFPLPEDAAVDRLRMEVGDRVIEGVVRERLAARAVYEQARQEGKRASLVEQERPNVFTTSVANIPPGAHIAVEIEYQHRVRHDAGSYRLRFPMVVGPRYIPGGTATAAGGTGRAADTDQVPDASRITPPVRRPDRGAVNPVTMRIDLAPEAPLARIDSPFHRIDTTALHDGRYWIELADGSVPGDRDFELVWTPTARPAPTVALFTEQQDRGAFALLMVTPPAARAAEPKTTPREVVFVIDTSGSMEGASIGQARAALALALSRLGPADAFNVIQFNSVTSSLFAQAVPASPDNVARAVRYANGLRAQGGTEMLPALRQALDGQAHPARLRQVIFLTDGSVGNEEALFRTIRERLGGSRLFTIGIGSAPNSHFMRQAAAEGRGTFTYIGSTTEVGDRMGALFRKLESPVLTDVRLELDATTPVETLPERIPDLYAGEPVLVTLRAEMLPLRAVLRGRIGDREWEQEVPLHRAREGAGLAVDWGRHKIAALVDTLRAGAREEDVRRAVLEVALAHHLVSRYTSLVAVDVTPVRPDGQHLVTQALATNLPQGWDYAAVLGTGQGATAAPVHLIAGALTLILAAALGGLLRWHAH
jgi:Ca-activated chloride channel family protein